jgi:hypothetical protein
MKNARRAAPKRRNPLAACLSHGAYQPKRAPSALEKARARAARPKHRHAEGRHGELS